MSKYIMIKGNQVVNIIVTDNKEQSEQDLFCTLVPVTDGLEYNIGWIWDGEKFTDPDVLNAE